MVSTDPSVTVGPKPLVYTLVAAVSSTAQRPMMLYFASVFGNMVLNGVMPPAILLAPHKC
jgi:hypothetical protein